MSCPAHVSARAHAPAHASAAAPIPSRPVATPATTAAAAVSPACWRLSAGHAISLGPTAPSQLRIVRGRVWVTLATPALPQTLDAERLWPASGDHVLTAGDLLDVPAGASLVDGSLAHHARRCGATRAVRLARRCRCRSRSTHPVSARSGATRRRCPAVSPTGRQRTGPGRLGTGAGRSGPGRVWRLPAGRAGPCPEPAGVQPVVTRLPEPITKNGSSATDHEARVSMGRALCDLSKSIVKNNSCLRNLYKLIFHFICLKMAKKTQKTASVPLGSAGFWLWRSAFQVLWPFSEL